MSHPVNTEELSEQLAEYGGAAFVITVGGDGVPKVVHVPVVWDGEVLRCTPGGGTLANLASPAPVTMVFPPPGDGAFSMILDGEGTADGEVAVVALTGGVLHRPAPDSPGDQIRC
jgi:hypothetical protein